MSSSSSDLQQNPTPTLTLTFITSNPNKLSEVRSILLGDDEDGDDGDGGGVSRSLGLRSRSLPQLVEIQGSVEEIARDKCCRAAELVNGPVLTEDTALEFRALKGLPGPYIKWFLDSLGHAGLNNLLAAYEDKSAEAVCTFAFSHGPGKEPLIFQGRTLGKIVPARGPTTFGWDPIFEYEGQTYAEMDKASKNLISHRYKALEKLKAWLATEAVVPTSYG